MLGSGPILCWVPGQSCVGFRAILVLGSGPFLGSRPFLSVLVLGSRPFLSVLVLGSRPFLCWVPGQSCVRFQDVLVLGSRPISC